jgi:hypothetical protein
MQFIYIADFLIFEHQFLTSFEVQSEGFGALALLGYGLYPMSSMVLPLFVVNAK